MIDFLKEALSIEDEIIKIRREFHMHPELGFSEYDTSKIIKKFLLKENIDFKSYAKTGIKAVIKGNGKKTVALRSDMDALPILEKNQSSYKSKNDGVMHACGHDAHMAILMGAAMILNKHRKDLLGNVVLIFEPAEETLGGARFMIEEGVLHNPEVDAIIGLHVEEGLNTGTIGLKRGTVNAASNPFTINIIGRGAHGAHPEDGIDPIVIASNLIMSIQTLVSREISPMEPSVITIGSIHGGTAPNAIPEEVQLKGIIRTMGINEREYLKERLISLTEGLVSSMGGKAVIDISDSYPCLYNNDKMEELIIKTSKELLGVEKLIMLKKPSMGVESFSYFANAAPSVFYYLGCRNEKKGIINPAHGSFFDVDEDSLKIGAALQAMAAFRYLENFEI